MVYMFPIERPSQRLLIAFAVIFSLVPATAVGLRILARRLSNRKLDSGDYLIIAACVVAVAYQAVVLTAVVAGGLGWHTTELLAMGGNDSFLVLVVQVLWSISLGLTKGSILLVYAKVFSLPRFIVASKLTALLILLWALVLIVGPFVICQPLEYNWNPYVPGGHCGNTKLLWYITGIFNIITDLIVLLLPMPYLYALELAPYKKAALMCTFGIGFLVCIISAVRLATLVNVDIADFAFSGPIAVMFSALEPCLLITAASVPFLRPLLGRQYSSTGTARFGSASVSHKSHQRAQKESSGFNKLTDDESTRRLRPERIQYDAQVGVKDGTDHSIGDSATDQDVELGVISVKKDWKVEEGPASGGFRGAR
ncbi:hypothetical protein BJ170DRAFT_722844 [Xylariales sp. AK1849]|nr:hypothetical protein BJ170DRAFT_722844 [Xylariales sp. AK1849]